MDWLIDIKNLCSESGKACPKELYPVYDVKNKVLQEKYSHSDEHCEDEDLEKSFKEKFNKWFKDAKSGAEDL